MTDNNHAAESADHSNCRETVDCNEHGPSYETFVCKHLVAQPHQVWFSCEPTKDDPWPDAWCSECNLTFEANGNEWLDGEPEITLLCHHCYDSLRARSKMVT